MASVFLPLLAATGAVLAAKFSPSDITRSTTFGNTLPNKFIVEVDSAQNIPGRRALDTRRPHDIVYEHLQKRELLYSVDKEFDSPGLFTGSVLTLDNAHDVAKVREIPGVKAIRPVTIIPPPKPVMKHVVTGPTDSAIPADSESTHIITNVDKLHAQGILGKGIKIGIIDTGVDYTHPFLGGAFGAGHKVIGGHDFVGDAYSTNTPTPDNDPLDQCNGHGTHVAGIIGADPGNPFNVSGVAYEASINAYRIFGCAGSVSDDIIVEALLQGYKDGNDILTLSLGGSDGWTESSSSVVSSRIAAAGRIVTIAAGNDGAVGSWYSSSPGNAINAISVASLDNTIIPLQNLTVQGVTHDPITYFSALPLAVKDTLPLYATSKDATIVDDACNPLPDTTPDLSKYVVLVRRGSCAFTQKLGNVAAKGAKVTLIYDNGNGFAGIEVGNYTSVLIQAADGTFLAQQLAAGKEISVSFPQSGASTQFPDPHGGLISDFTTYGPSNDFHFKPAIAAPGGNILSTYPVPMGTYAVLSGTSMATPFMAGVSALLFQTRGKAAEVGRNARTIFETTAQRVPSSKTDGDPLQTVTQQGAGLINAFAAVHSEVFVSPSELITNDTAHYKAIHTFTVKNNGKDKKSFKITHHPAGTALTFQQGIPATGPVPLSATAATVEFFPSSLTIWPGLSETVVVVIKPPKGLNSTDNPVFSGFLEVANTEESYHVTYLGLAAALKDTHVVDNSDTFFGVKIPAIFDSNSNVVNTTQNFTFQGTDFPSVVSRLNFGTPLIRFDLVKPDIKLTTSLSRRDEGVHVFERWDYSFPWDSKPNTFATVQTVGPLFSATYQPRNSNLNDGTGFNEIALPKAQFTNGTTIPNGPYRILLRALKVTGDPTQEKDFESWLSPVIGIQA
ncbi:subtilisin-like protease [Ganoderma leucocontextum]|nr:subtilisin-like protease [Ganoderma leucocontextum]